MIFRNNQFLIFSITLSLFFLGCSIHDDFEEPEPWDMPAGNLLTVSQLREMFSGEPVRFEDHYSVYATVTMDDKSGNIYRSAFIQDQSGAINLRLVAPGGIYTGDSILLNLKGTTLASYQRMLQLDNVNADRNIKKLAVGKQVPPLNASIQSIRTGNHQGQLVRLENVQFMAAESGRTFADKEGLRTINRILEDCDGNTLIVRTSGYAGFADEVLPEGNGSLVAVVSQFQNDMQLFIRTLDDVQLTGERCVIPGDDFTLLPVAALREQFRQGVSLIPPNSRIEGVVISDREHSNHPGQNLYLTDDSGQGIAIRFSRFHDFDLGSRIRIIFASPMPMSEFRGLLQIDQVPGGNAFDLGPGVIPQPATMTISEAISNMETLQSTLVRFENITISGGNTFSGNLNISDASGMMLLYTYNWASFAGTRVPSGQVTITGILSAFDSPQLLIRSLNDITQ